MNYWTIYLPVSSCTTGILGPPKIYPGVWSYTVQPRVEVFYSSPRRRRKYLELFALYIKRENKYDFRQYCANEKPSDKNHVPFEGWIFTQLAMDLATDDDPPFIRGIGACCFRLRNVGDKEVWHLDWVWLHPFCRGKGELRKHWDFFKQRYGDFAIEPPISPSMQRFLRKPG